MKYTNQDRINLLLVLGMFLAIFVLINAQQWIISAVIYLVMGAFCFNVSFRWSKIGKKSDLEGIDNNWIKDALVGLGLGILTIIMGSIFSFIGAIGIPNVQTVIGTVGRFLIVVIFAPLFEETFFGDYMMDFFNSKIGLPLFFSIPLTGVIFSLYHTSAYGGSLTLASGSFFSAFLMGCIFRILSEKQNSLIGSIIFHATLNFYIGFVTLSVI